MMLLLRHDPEKACPGLDPGWIPVFGKDHAQITIAGNVARDLFAAFDGPSLAAGVIG
jgi:hypothetical protein